MKKITTFLLSTVFLSKTLASKALRRVVRIILFLIIFSSFSSYAIAGLQVKQDISKMVQRSDLIIRGKVISTESQRKDDSRGRHIYTSVTVKILDTIRGNIKDETLAFEVVGGTVDNRVEIVSHTPVFEIGEDAIVFLKGYPWTVQRGTVGKILVYDGGVYWDDREITVESFLGALRSLDQDPGATISLEGKRQAQTAEATDVPIITDISFDEALAATNKQVTITGTNFGSTRGSNKVEFLNKNRQQKIQASVLSWSNTQIICTAPANLSAGSNLITVSTIDGTSGGYVIQASDCYITGKKWASASPVVKYKINENCSDCTGEGAAVQRAAATWNNVGANFTFQYDGTHSRTSASDNWVNEIMWGTLDWGIAAESTIYFYVGQPIDGADIVFNDYYTWSTKSTPYSYEYDVESVALHELGHWIQLYDLEDYACSDCAMYYQLGDGEVLRILCWGDCDGICYMYPKSGCGCKQDPDLYDDGESYRSFSPTTIQGGQSLSISCDVHNGGTAASGPFVVKFYASTNTTISSSDPCIGQEGMSSIPASNWANCDWTGVFPSSIPYGTYYVGWIIDANNTVLESNENNNTAYKQGYQLTVVPCACLGDLDENEQVDLQDLDALVNMLVAAGPPFIVPVGPGHCGDLAEPMLQVDLQDLDALVNLLVNAGPPFIVPCE